MVRGIAGRLDARFVLILGKGGVGKTTTAGALALALADEGERVHLISTDPAHSLGDLFDVNLSGTGATASPCTDRLVLEELDASRYAEAWIERAREPLLEVFDRGTYLDPEDVEGFLDLTLPGVDEVAAALRLAELSEGDAERVVVDTAPTGHALRLLRAADVVASWADAFEAMEEKARAVIEGLMRQRVRLSSGEVVEDLEDRVRRFREQVLAGGEAVVVDRAGSVVEAETGRLIESLGDSGVRVSLRVRTGAPGAEARSDDQAGPDRVVVPFRTDLAGCEGLRAWGTAPSSAPDSTATDTTAGSTADPTPQDGGGAAELLRGLDVGLLLVVGKGGVGKSTCAAAAALLLAADRPVTLLSTDPAGSLEDVLDRTSGRAPSDAGRDADGEKRSGSGTLRVRQVEAEARFQEVRDRYRGEVEAAFDALSRAGDAALDRRVVRSLLDLAPPGIDEIFALLALMDDAREDATLVVDTAPTGHLVRLLSLPETALSWTHQLLRTLRKYRAVLGLDAFAESLLDFAKRLKDLSLRLTDPARSAAIVVTQPGPLVQAETGRLLTFLDRGGIRVAAVVWNRWPEGHEEGVAPSSTPVLRAPSLVEPPVGQAALEAFTRRWRLDA